MKTRTLFAIIVLLTMNFQVVIHGQDARVTNSAQAQATQDLPIVRVYKLRYSTADSAANTVDRLLQKSDLTITADPRTNSLLARGSSESLALLSALLENIDTPAEEASSKLAFVDSVLNPDMAAQILRMLRLDVDLAATEQGLLMASSDPALLQQAEDILQSLSQTQAKPVGSYAFEIYWLTEEQLDGASAFEEPVADKLQQRGFGELRIVSQIHVVTQPSQLCSATGNAMGGELTIETELERTSTGLSCRLILQALRNEKQTEIESSMLLQPDSWTVFGVTRGPTGTQEQSRDLFLVRIKSVIPLQ